MPKWNQWTRGHQISAQIKIRQLFLPPPRRPRRSTVPRFIPLHLSLILMCCQPWSSTSLKVERIRLWRLNTTESQSKGLQKMLTFVPSFWSFYCNAAGPCRITATYSWQETGGKLSPFQSSMKAEPSTWCSSSSLLLRLRMGFSVAITLRVNETLSWIGLVLHCSAKRPWPFQQHSPRKLCRRAQRWFQGFGSFLLHLRPTSLSQVVMQQEVFFPPSCNTRAPRWLLFNTTTGRVGDGRRMEMATEDSETGKQSTCMRVSCCPLSGLQKCWGFSSTLHQQGDSIWRLMSLQRCIYRSVANSGNLPVLNLFIYFQTVQVFLSSPRV